MFSWLVFRSNPNRLKNWFKYFPRETLWIKYVQIIDVAQWEETGFAVFGKGVWCGDEKQEKICYYRQRNTCVFERSGDGYLCWRISALVELVCPNSPHVKKEQTKRWGESVYGLKTWAKGLTTSHKYSTFHRTNIHKKNIAFILSFKIHTHKRQKT